MNNKIKIKVGTHTFTATLKNTPTAEAVLTALPLQGHASTWGKEIYFQASLPAKPEQDAKAEVEPGDLAFWPGGQAFCIFYGPTPMSSGDNPVAAAPVNVIGKLDDPYEEIDEVTSGTPVIVSHADN